ncbi:uncharacterized protein METZ01_LOCUS423824, partial [marine metagenome]
MDSAAFAVASTDTFIESTSCTDPDSATNGAPMTALQNEAVEIGVGTANLPGPISIGNVSGADAGTWPIIYASDFADDNLIEYGSEAISFTYGQKAAGVSFTSTDADGIVVPGQKVQLTIDDNGLNIDPTTVDSWKFLGTSGSEASDRISTTDDDMIDDLPSIGFGDNGYMTIAEDNTISSTAIVSTTTTDTYTFTETGTNTGVFTLHDSFGNSDASISTTCGVDDKATFTYAGISIVHVCATGNASVSLDAGSEWSPSESASYTL